MIAVAVIRCRSASFFVKDEMPMCASCEVKAFSVAALGLLTICQPYLQSK